MGRAVRDVNYQATMLGIDSNDTSTVTPPYIDSSTGRLLVTAVVTAGATTATEYTEGDTDTTFSGIMLLGEGPSDTAIPFSVDANGKLETTANDVLDSIDAAVSSKEITGIGHGVKTITTAGTDEALAASTACKRVTIMAQTDNTGLIAVGGSGVDATVATGTGVLLAAGEAFELDIDNLSKIFVDATVNGEGVRYTYLT